MLRFEGHRDFPVPPAALFARLADARFLVQCAPDVDSVALAEPEKAELVVRPGFAFARGTLKVTMTLHDLKSPDSFRVDLFSQGIGFTSDVGATLQLVAIEAGTRVAWTAEVKKLTGLLKLAPSGLIRGAAEKAINDAWDRAAAALLKNP